MSMNKFIGIGRWSKEIELRYTPSGKAVASTTIAINEKYNGNQTTTFIPVVVWGKQAENVAQYSSKGRLVAIEGRLQIRNYDNNDGKKVYVTEVVADNVRFLESGGAGQQQSQPQTDPFVDDGKPIDISDDDLPF